jgi:hypothetical protein
MVVLASATTAFSSAVDGSICRLWFVIVRLGPPPCVIFCCQIDLLRQKFRLKII